METAVRINWPRLRELCRAGSLPVGIETLNKIKAGTRRFTEENAIAIHRATHGEFPCWVLRPDLWSEGQFPPSLDLAS